MAYFYGNQTQSFVFNTWGEVQQQMKGDKDKYYKKLPSKQVAEKFKTLYDKVVIRDWKKYAFSFEPNKTYIYTDGSAIDLKKVFPASYKRKEFVAGYGVYCPKTNTRLSKLYGTTGKGTVNQAELMAIIKALSDDDITKTKDKLVIFTDSIYSYHSILFYKFLKQYAPERGNIENEDLIQLASHLVRKHKVSLVKIMSHTDEDKKKQKKLKDIEKLYGVNTEFYRIHLEGNNIADELALKSTRDAVQTIKHSLR